VFLFLLLSLVMRLVSDSSRNLLLDICSAAFKYCLVLERIMAAEDVFRMLLMRELASKPHEV